MLNYNIESLLFAIVLLMKIIYFLVYNEKLFVIMF